MISYLRFGDVGMARSGLVGVHQNLTPGCFGSRSGELNGWRVVFNTCWFQHRCNKTVT